ncbi:MAG: iron-siderophore ABC transporter substrate-binding protein [Cyanomargarita calcarea GSE-NOS-MK-12-04C]|jgi:iron complex transport system substrate-binding protein|uniref:Iron-siderophore ABC transporter substrate-binding protein n=1 Tax=Cyanomargarita calcarea GSE-NOS-MK-12-04C TaxID=2839659 RepID=A0A951QHU0_9CYAN|nr:iron-siderophore ABC transporter substrate-binding protein [Cyanomargarita calcarea GSE-NOS-MK-12-04C]
MNRLIHILIKSFILMALSFILITACNNRVNQKLDLPLVSTSECRFVQHKLGKTCIPIEPQRVIALDSRYLADPLINIGVKPTAIAIYNEKAGKTSTSGLSLGEVEGIENVGEPNSPSLEKIVMLKPDLILGLDIFHEKIYKLLSAIAPTVIVNYDDYFKKSFLHIAQLLDREKNAEEALTQYQNRIKRLQSRLGEKLNKVNIATIFYYHGTFSSMADQSTCAQIFTDIGLRHKTTASTSNIFSIEEIHKYDADILFIVNADYKSSSFYLENPLISSLKAVQNGQVYIVDPDIWTGNGLSGVNKILDDLFKYLPVDK